MLGFALTAPGYTMRDMNDWFDGQRLSAESLCRNRLPSREGRFSVPLFVIQGSEDFTTPTSLAKDFVGRVVAPKKRFVTIAGGHFALFMNSSEFLRQLSAVLRM